MCACVENLDRATVSDEDSIKDIIISKGLRGVIYHKSKVRKQSAVPLEPPENKGDDDSLRYRRNHRTQAKLIGRNLFRQHAISQSW